ncbi:hypothetical protein Hanom_Chr05g00436241 [Helianthus anomalus]
MLINDQYPELEKRESDKMLLEHMNSITLERFESYKSKDKDQIAPFRGLFEHLKNLDYEASTNSKWRHDDSSSDKENEEEGEKMKGFVYT